MSSCGEQHQKCAHVTCNTLVPSFIYGPRNMWEIIFCFFHASTCENNWLKIRCSWNNLHFAHAHNSISVSSAIDHYENRDKMIDILLCASLFFSLALILRAETKTEWNCRAWMRRFILTLCTKICFTCLKDFFLNFWSMK